VEDRETEDSLSIDLKIALKREVGVLPILYNCGFSYCLWLTYDVIWGGLCDMLGNWGVKRLEVPL
jgi:hypothetical protein